MLTKFAARLIENAEFQWSHFFSEMEIILIELTPEEAVEAGFNGATSFQKWKSIDASRNESGEFIKSFNGATSFQKWK